MLCPRCQSSNAVKDGLTHYGKQRFKCANCGRQFIAESTRYPSVRLLRLAAINGCYCPNC